jgi:centrosomal protein CEP104
MTINSSVFLFPAPQLLSMNLQDGATSRPPYEPESVATPSKLGAEVVTVLPPIGTPPPGPAAPHDADERPLPTVSKQISETKSSDSSTPDPKPSPSTLAPPGDPLEDAPVDVPTQPEPLAERDVQEMLVVLDIFEETLVAKVCSRSWQLREKGLQEMLEFLRTSYGPACVSREQGRNATRAMVLVLKRLFKDKVQVVFIATWELLQFLITEYIPSHKLAKSEVAYLVERSLPVLMGRIGERTNQSHRGYSPQQIVTSLAQIPDVKSLHIIQNNLQQPIKFSVAPKIAQARMEVLEELVKQFGVGESTGFVLQEVVLVAKGVVEHPSSPVRDVSYRLIVDLYREYGKPVKGCLPGDDDRIRKILTWRRIFEQFDRIDGKPTKAELAARAVDAEKQKMQVDVIIRQTLNG